MQLLNLPDVHDRRVTDAKKLFGVEFCFQAGQRFANQVRLASRMQVDVVISRLDPIDLAHRQEENSSTRFHDQSLEITMLRPHALEQRHQLLVDRLCGLSLYLEARSLKRLLKTFAIERLQQVI